MDKCALGSVTSSASTGLPQKVMFALAKVVEQRHASLFPTQLIIEGVLTMLCLETPSDLVATGWGIQFHERNELKFLDKEHVKN
jgi:hypothetical protein